MNVQEVLVALLIIVVVWLVMLSIAAGTAVWTMRRANEVVKGTRSPAPVLWLWSPSKPARLHRRLRHVFTWDSPERPKVHGELWDELEAEAVRLDADIASLTRAPRPVRRRAHAAMAPRVEYLANLAARIRRLEADATAPRGFEEAEATEPTPTDGLVELDERIANLESAHNELSDFERLVGEARAEAESRADAARRTDAARATATEENDRSAT